MIWQTRFFTIEWMETHDIMFALGWWDGAVELWLGKGVIRFQGAPADYR